MRPIQLRLVRVPSPPVKQRYFPPCQREVLAVCTRSTALMCVPVRLGGDIPPVLLLSYANQSRSAAETPDGI